MALAGAGADSVYLGVCKGTILVSFRDISVDLWYDTGVQIPLSALCAHVCA